MLLVWYCQYFLQFTKHRVHPLNTNIYVTLISDLCFCLRIGWCLEDRMLAFIIFLENSPPHTSLIFQLYNSIMHFFSTLLTEMIPLEHNYYPAFVDYLTLFKAEVHLLSSYFLSNPSEEVEQALAVQRCKCWSRKKGLFWDTVYEWQACHEKPTVLFPALLCSLSVFSVLLNTFFPFTFGFRPEAEWPRCHHPEPLSHCFAVELFLHLSSHGRPTVAPHLHVGRDLLHLP